MIALNGPNESPPIKARAGGRLEGNQSSSDAPVRAALGDGHRRVEVCPSGPRMKQR